MGKYTIVLSAHIDVKYDFDADSSANRAKENYIFVCADMDAKVRRCLGMADKGENLSRKELERKIRSIDKKRSQTRERIILQIGQ